MVYTSFTYGYLTRAVVLAETLRRAHPEWMLWALIVDLLPDGHEDDKAKLGTVLAVFDRVVHAHTLEIDHFKSWIFKHDVIEACTAVKGQMLCALLNAGAEHVLYFDPDIAVFHPMSNVIEALEENSIVLTPHQLTPNITAEAVLDNEVASMRFGIYNLGFLAVRNDFTGMHFARWWRDQLLRACYDEPESGIFTDQKYCDAVPALFERVLVVRDAGCNVASWNISQRNVTFGLDGEIRVNGSLLKFYHFTKIFGVGEAMTERYTQAGSAVTEIVAWYRAQVLQLAETLQQCCQKEFLRDMSRWSYGSFGNGVTITKSARVLYRGDAALMNQYRDPFDTEERSFYKWLLHERPEMLS